MDRYNVRAEKLLRSSDKIMRNHEFEKNLSKLLNSFYADIIQSFSNNERSMKKNSIYALIMRMKREGRITERNGRYY